MLMQVLRDESSNEKGYVMIKEKQVRKNILIKGIVQGVGFRPFVYRMASDYNIRGYVKNTSNGLYIDAEGNDDDINKFMKKIENNPPKLSKIVEMIIEDKEEVSYETFDILKSDEEDGPITLISPDIGVCEDCLTDIRNKKNRRYKYPFTNCTNCGPRYTIIKSLPYDRQATSMNEFEMCSECRDEYENPNDRRFHTQPTACPVCGPKLNLIDNKGNEILCEDVIKETVRLIKCGYIIAIKGLGGFHLMCDAKSELAIQCLRDRKGRPTKPFAIMMRNINVVKKHCELNDKEEKVLCSERKPIVLLNKKNDLLSPRLAPYNDKLGVMLPYTPLHQLIFDEGMDELVMTSANKNGMPIIYKNNEAMESLNDIADYIILHDRDIFIPVDDSVSTVILEEERVIRSSRGYAPTNMKYPMKKDILACGSHMKNTFALSKGDNIFISQYIGDIENVETYERVTTTIKHLEKLYNIKPEVIAYDMHPNYWSTDYVKAEEARKIAVQHHHAHIVSCMVENGVQDKVIGIAYDGSGYGIDKTIWGGEFLICDYANFERVGHLNYVSMPGGEIAVKEPWRMAISYLHKTYGEEFELPKALNNKETKVVKTMLKNNINVIETSSMGRLFDAIAALLGFSGKTSYEGEAASYLEYLCDKTEKSSYLYGIDEYIVNTDSIIKGVVDDIKSGIDFGIIARKFHNTVIFFSVHICELLSKKHNIKKVALSGGVFQNKILLEGIFQNLIRKGYEVYTHKKIPCNDGGICLGQIVIANENLNN